MSVLNLTEHSKMQSNQHYMSSPVLDSVDHHDHRATERLQINNHIHSPQKHQSSKCYALLQAGTASNGCSEQQMSQQRPLPQALQLPDNSREFDRKISQDSTTADEDNPGGRASRRKTANSGVRARIARRKRMKDANALDVAHGTLSDQEATSEAYDEDDSVEEKQDNEPMDDWQSSKGKSPQQLFVKPSAAPVQVTTSTSTTMSLLTPPDMTPETARKNWNSRFSNLKSSFNAASEEDLSKSRSPSIHRQDLDERGRPKAKEASRSPMVTRGANSFQASGSSSPAMNQRVERPQSKEDKDKENSIRASSLSNVQPNMPKKLSAPNAGELSKSKQPTPSRENNVVNTRATKSMPRDTSYDAKSRAEILGLVKASRGEDENAGAAGAAAGGAHNKSGSGDMDYQEYMNIIHKVRKTKEHSRIRAEHYRLDSMYAKEKIRQEELQQEEQRLQEERQKIEAERREGHNLCQ